MIMKISTTRGRPRGSTRLNRPLVDQISELTKAGLRFKEAAAALGIPERTAHDWRERGRRLESEFLGIDHLVPAEERIFLHFSRSLEAARATGIGELLQAATRNVRSTSDALKLLEFVCPEEYGRAARERRAQPKQLDLSEELCRIANTIANRPIPEPLGASNNLSDVSSEEEQRARRLAVS